MRVDKHGLRIKGLRAASGSTVDWDPDCSAYVQVMYSQDSGEVWTELHATGSEYSVPHDASAITVADARRHMTMQEIADCIAYAVHIELPMGRLEDEMMMAEQRDDMAAYRAAEKEWRELADFARIPPSFWNA